MSVEDNKRTISAYEQMLKDGTAFKEVDMTMHSEPDVSIASGSLGDRINESQPKNEIIEDEYTDYSHFDDHMEQRIQSLRNKMKDRGSSSRKTSMNESKEITSLKKRVAKLEEAMMLIMETHEKLLG